MNVRWGALLLGAVIGGFLAYRKIRVGGDDDGTGGRRR
jgi:hypothetical protein